MFVNIYTDGGSRGNPGFSGFGVVVYDDKKNILYQESKFLGIKTNNEAEYMGLIAALTWLSQNHSALSIQSYAVFSDSQLMVRQVQGKYKVKAPHLRPLHQAVLSLITQIHLPYKFQDVLRESNELADKLANIAMDRRL
jgi:ribonuclease HI